MKRSTIFLFILSLFIYNISFIDTFKGDTTPAKLLPFNILSGRGIYFEDYKPYLAGKLYYFQEYDGHLVSAYPLLTGLIATPVYLPFFIFLSATGQADPKNLYSLSFVAEKLSASIIASVSVVLFFILMKDLSKSNKISLIFALIFAFATQTFSISSQLLWQHGTANLFLVASLIFLHRGKGKDLYLSFIFAILAFFARFSFLIYVVLLLMLAFRLKDKHFKRYLTISIGGFLTLALYNLYLFHAISGSANESIADFGILNFFEGLSGLIASPAKGLVFYTPFFIFSFLSILIVRKIREAKEVGFFYINYLFLCSILLLYSFYKVWWSGWDFGNRYLTDAAVPAVILSYYFYNFSKNTLTRVALALLILYSCLIQIIGVFYYPKGHWDDYPINIVDAPRRVWDFSDNPIFRNLWVGPKINNLDDITSVAMGFQPRNYPVNERTCSMEKIVENSFLGYRLFDVNLQNGSKVDWFSKGGNVIDLKQIYFKGAEIIGQSPIPATLPRIVKSGEKIKVRVLVVAPEGATTLLIAPVQEDVAWWVNSCRVIYQL